MSSLFRLFFALVFSGLLVAGAAAAEMRTLAPAIIVNDKVISALELEMRVKLAMVSSGLQDTPETREFLERQVEQALIDEELQSQEAERLGIGVDPARVDEAFERIARGNGLTTEVLRGRLQNAGILPDYLLDQIRAQILWRSVLESQVLSRVVVTGEDIDDAVRRIEARLGQPQRLMAEIVLPINNAAEANEIMQTAEQVVDQLRRGASFQALARQVSQSPTAVAGGDLGWVDPGLLPAEVETAIEGLPAGSLSPPIQTIGAIYIVLIRDERPAPERRLTVSLRMLTFPVDSFENTRAVNQAAGRATQASRALTDCSVAEAVAERFGGRVEPLPDPIDVSRLPGGLRGATNELPLDQASELFRAPGGIGLAIVCAREDSGIDRELVRERLISEQVDSLSRRYLQDLRRLATVEMRS